MTDDWKRSNYNTALDAMRRNEGAFDPAEKAQDFSTGPWKHQRYRAHPDRHGTSGALLLLLGVMMFALIIGLVVSVVRGL